MDNAATENQGATVLGQRPCARPDGCCVDGPLAGWCDALRASLVATADGGWQLPVAWPRLGTRVVTPAGPGMVARVRIPDGVVTVALDDGGAIELAAAVVTPVEAA